MIFTFYLYQLSAESLNLTLESSVIHVECFTKNFEQTTTEYSFLCLILLFMFICSNFLFRAFVTMIYWTSTEVLLNLVAPLDSPVPSLDFEQINIF